MVQSFWTSALQSRYGGGPRVAELQRRLAHAGYYHGSHTHAVSDIYQAAAARIALAEGIHRVHLDLSWWRA